MKAKTARCDGEKMCELRLAASNHYSYHQLLADVYRRSNDRIRAYLCLLFMRSYTLFVLHDRETSDSFLPDMKEARAQLTDADLKQIASAHKLISEKDCIDGILHGDTMDVLEWDTPGGKTRDIGKEENLPLALRTWLESARSRYRGMNLQAIYDLKSVYITFKYDEAWYKIASTDIEINKEAFDHLADELVQELRSIGARWVLYHGQLD